MIKSYTFPIEYYNVARKKMVSIIEENKVIIKGVEHQELKTSENDVFYLVDGKIHREDEEPACRLEKYGVYYKIWVKNGLIHRDNDQYAIQRTSGVEYWYCWYKNGKRHRDGDKPAECSNQRQIWYKNDKIHRETGYPAIIETGMREDTYWINGSKVTKEQAEAYAKIGRISENF